MIGWQQKKKILSIVINVCWVMNQKKGSQTIKSTDVHTV